MTGPHTTTARTHASAVRPVPAARLPRRALLADAAVTGLNGAGYLLAAPLLADVLGLGAGPLRVAGVSLLGFAAVVLLVGTRAAPPPGAVLAVVVANLLWVAGSVAVALTGWGTPTAVGTGWVALQAAVVAALAALQWRGLRAATGS
jgi:hypothetical protein